MRQHGFTFIEVLLVIGILGLITGLAIPFYQSFQISSQLDNTTQTLIQTLQRARQQAMASVSYSEYGVRIASDSITLFRGAAWQSGEAFNEVTTIPGTLTLTTDFGGEVLFSRTTGLPTHTGAIMIEASNGKQRIVTISNIGVVNVL